MDVAIHTKAAPLRLSCWIAFPVRGVSTYQQLGSINKQACPAVEWHATGTSTSRLSQRLLLGHKAVVTALAVGGSGGNILASAAAAQSRDKPTAAILLWDLPSGRRLCSISGAPACRDAMQQLLDISTI